MEDGVMTSLRSGRGSVVLSGQAAAALAEALGETPAAELSAPAAAKRSRAARLLYRAALAIKPYLRPVLRRVEARIGTAVNKSSGVISLQNGVISLQNEVAALRAAADRSDQIAARSESQIAALRADVEILLQRFTFQVGEGMLASRNRYGYLVLPTTDLTNVGYLVDGMLPEQGSREVLEKLLAPGDVFVDLGANVGLFTLVGARCVGAAGHVHAVEPAPDLAAALGLLAALNQIATFVTIHPVAAGAKEGSAELFLARTSGHNALFAEEIGLTSLKVRLAPLDALITPGSAVSLVKMDIEGSELEALAGMVRVIADNPRIVILAEFSPSIIRRSGGTPEGWIAAVRSMNLDILEVNEATGTLEPLRAQGLGELLWINLVLHRPEGRPRLEPLLPGAA
jgi:FkbM family methyltransferase